MLPHRAISALRRSLLAALLVVPSAAAVGCVAPEDEDAVASEDAVTGRRFDEGSVLRVTANTLNVRVAPGKSSRWLTSVHRGDLVTVVATSGSNGWVNIRTPGGRVGWSAGNYLALHSESGDDDDVSGPAVGDTCAATRAEDVVNPYQKALHDAIAYAEGTRGRSNDGYDILFGGSSFSTCARHPNRCIRYGRSCSTAAGRYQFLHGTWRSVSNVLGYATFEPENQERGAKYLIGTVRRATVPSDRPLTSSEFSNVMSKISYEWASLPPGRYGQPMKSMTELRRVYCEAAGC